MIVAVLETSESFWLPIFSFNDHIFESHVFALYLSVHITIYAVSAYLICRTCTIFLTIKVFHENMNILMAWFLFQWFEAIFAKLIIAPFQIGLIEIGSEPKRAYYPWWTDDRSEMIVVTRKTDVMPLFIACFFLWHYMMSMVLAIMAVGFERICATLYIKNYESVARRHIALGLILLTNAITIPYAWHICHHHVAFEIVYGQCVLSGGTVFFGFLVLWRVNLVLRNRMDRLHTSGDTKYSLAKKFQVEENIRSLRLAKKLVVVSSLYLTVSFSAMFSLVFGLLRGYEQLFVHILDNSTTLAAPVLSITLLFCSPAWKSAFIAQIPGCRRSRHPRVNHMAPRKTAAAAPSAGTSPSREADVYFEQLRNAWV